MINRCTINRSGNVFLFLGCCIFFIIQGQSLEALDTRLQTELTIKDLTFGVRFEYSGYMASSVHMGPSYNMNSEGLPLGGVLRIRQSFLLPKFPFELAVSGEVEAFNSDTGLLFLPSMGVDLGLRFKILKQDFLFSAGYRYGFIEFMESYKGDVISVERIDRITAMPLHLGLIWKL